ncbi:putative indole-3-pyruvate monooxygenase YUCCA10 [Hibiscus syriacus]|uniref:Flavin-containing monooxygenase n=1 Tax=Hibiscus syriacus TaxID=106335 RepID=A0A6A2ZQE7_HIBSY|nr:probable indole-3-pyruvate monooxygenase YUCCA10 [Hibiscus syriacus]KAE8694118.1 putative indole-3-pyruvate monooxygenase YUCCA10 [Hibiscus syriacus]
MEQVVVIVGAGPSGLATSACLSVHSIPHVILEREDVYASLWKKRAYDRLKLHLAKEFCALPFKPHSPDSPTYIPKDMFVDYLDDYVKNFNIQPLYRRSVELAFYDKATGKWRIEAKNMESGAVEVYVAEFLVIASGENSAKYVPDLPGLDTFKGEIIHSNEYKSGDKYKNNEVLVVGCGNSGMEIAYDVSNFGVPTSIVIRSPFHVVTKEIVRIGMVFSKYIPIRIVDFMAVWMSKIVFGDLSKYGIHKPKEGPFFLKATAGRAPVIDVGTIGKIKSKEIKVVPAISKIDGKKVIFEDGVERKFDVIIFATGYRSATNKWLKDYDYALNEEGMPKNNFPHHWKGENNLYCCGLSRRGLLGVSMDAVIIANDIKKVVGEKKNK